MSPKARPPVKSTTSALVGAGGHAVPLRLALAHAHLPRAGWPVAPADVLLALLGTEAGRAVRLDGEAGVGRDVVEVKVRVAVGPWRAARILPLRLLSEVPAPSAHAPP